MIPEPLWLQRELVDALHADQIRRYGGSHGVRDLALIDSALARAMNRWSYGEDVDLADLAAAYGYVLAKSHGYVDGNKRIALIVVAVFVDLNEYDLVAPEPEVVHVMIEVADGSRSEADLAAWIRQHLQPR